MSKSLKTLLLVEDNPDDRILFKKFISLGGFHDWQIVEKSRLDDAIAFMDQNTPEVILLDLSLPDSSDIESYNRIKRINASIPVIVLTGMSDLELAKELIKRGAQDYLMKGEITAPLLEKAIGYAIERNKLKIENDHTKEKLLDSVLEAQDVERARIAKELHDGVVQSLTAVSLNLGLLRGSVSKFDTKTVFHYEKCTDNLALTIDEIRSISHSLMPRTIADMSLVNALEALVSDMKEVSGIAMELVTNFNHDLDEKPKISIYRIVQELINNAVKHSKASKMLIQLIDYPDTISLMVEDDGIGFDLLNVTENKSCFGLQSLESRVNVTGGHLEIDTQPGRGTNITISVPKRGPV